MGEMITTKKSQDFSTYSCEKFVEVLASKAPVPGGGSASALVGAIGIALGNMVGSLTIGKPKYSDVETEIHCLKKKANELQTNLLQLINEDAITPVPGGVGSVTTSVLIQHVVMATMKKYI